MVIGEQELKPLLGPGQTALFNAATGQTGTKHDSTEQLITSLCLSPPEKKRKKQTKMSISDRLSSKPAEKTTHILKQMET